MQRANISQPSRSRNRSTIQSSSTDGIVLQCDLLSNLASFYGSDASFEGGMPMEGDILPSLAELRGTTPDPFITDLYGCLTILYQFLVTTVLLAATSNECLRLYLGYIGNLSDKVPELAGFWLLSLVPQLPLQLFLLLNQNILLQPLEQIVQSVSVLLLITQLVSGFFALRHSSKVHAMQSRLHILLSAQQKGD